MDVSIEQFKSAMSLFPTGVAVITTQPEGHEAFGMTVNSFTSLSLHPPLVMWNLQKSSDTFKAWHNVETFAVNFLRADQAERSAHYARKGEHDLAPDVIERSASGCPLLADSLASLECSLHARHEEGDHVIMIGEVLAIQSQPDAAPLIFHRGNYTEPA